MEIISLKRMLPEELIQQIDDICKEWGGDDNYKVIYGQMVILRPSLGDQAAFDVIATVVCNYFHVNTALVLSSTRKIPFITYRQYIIYFTEQILNLKQADIRYLVGIKERSSISHSLKIVRRYMKSDKYKQRDIRKLRALIDLALDQN